MRVIKRKKDKGKMTEKKFLESLNYKHPEKINTVCIQAITCGGRDDFYGRTYLTERGRKIMEGEIFEEGDEYVSDHLKYFEKVYIDANGERLRDLKKVIEKYPERFEKKSESSIFKQYRYITIEDHGFSGMCKNISVLFDNYGLSLEKSKKDFGFDVIEKTSESIKKYLKSLVFNKNN